MKEEVDKHEHVYEMRNEVKKKFMIKNLSGGLWASVGLRGWGQDLKNTFQRNRFCIF